MLMGPPGDAGEGHGNVGHGREETGLQLVGTKEFREPAAFIKELGKGANKDIVDLAFGIC
jgi:hypothetical protein